MRDGRTHKIQGSVRNRGFSEFLAAWRAAIVVLSGGVAGSEHELERPRISLGRGPGADLAFGDDSMSHVHAALEFANGGFRVRDLGSTNGVLLNGAEVEVGDLKNGDRFELGQHRFQFLLEKRRREPKAYLLPDE
jgi:pSer/pThr/pTyr-binding forkhead associated (FHA) protein